MCALDSPGSQSQQDDVDVDRVHPVQHELIFTISWNARRIDPCKETNALTNKHNNNTTVIARTIMQRAR